MIAIQLWVSNVGGEYESECWEAPGLFNHLWAYGTTAEEALDALWAKILNEVEIAKQIPGRWVPSKIERIGNEVHIYD